MGEIVECRYKGRYWGRVLVGHADSSTYSGTIIGKLPPGYGEGERNQVFMSWNSERTDNWFMGVEREIEDGEEGSV